MADIEIIETPGRMTRRPGLHVLEGFTYLCSVPDGLGYVTKLHMRSGKIVAETASGIPMIVPTPK